LTANGTLTSNVSVSPGASLRGTGHISGPVLVRGDTRPRQFSWHAECGGHVTMTAGSTFQEGYQWDWGRHGSRQLFPAADNGFG